MVVGVLPCQWDRRSKPPIKLNEEIGFAACWLLLATLPYPERWWLRVARCALRVSFCLACFFLFFSNCSTQS